MTVKEFVDQHYRQSLINGLSCTMVSNYESYLKYFIIPYLGDKKLSEVNVATIQQFLDWMAEASKHGHRKDLKNKSIERISGLTSRIFRVALEMKLIDDTPFKQTLLHNRGTRSSHHSALPNALVDKVKM